MVDLLKTTLLPAGLCLLLAGLAGLLSRLLAARRDVLAGALGVSLGFAAGCVALKGWPGLPPNQITLWLPWLALLSVVPALVTAWRARETVHPRGSWLELGLRLLVCGLSAWALMARKLELWKSGPAASFTWIAGVAVGWMVLWGCLEGLALSLRARSKPGIPGGAQAVLVLAAWVGTAALAIVRLGSSALLAQLSGALACCLVVVCLLSLWTSRRALVFGVVPVVAVAQAGLLLNSAVYAWEPAWAVLGVAALPALALGILRVPPLYARLSWWMRTGLVLMILLVGAGGLIWWAYVPPPPNPYGY